MHSVTLHGRFATYHDGPVQIVGTTVAEVIEGLTRQVKGFAPHPVNGRQRLKVVGYESAEDLYKPLTEDTELHVVPQLMGGKDNMLLTVVLGVALVGVGIALGPATWLGGTLLQVGALSLLGGLAQLLAPSPNDNEADRSRYLGAPKNTVTIGTRIPILYGRHRVYGHYLSFQINATEFKGSAEESK